MPSAIGDVVPALVTLVTTAVGTGVTVHSGPKPSSDFSQEYVCVAYDPAGGDGVTSDQDPSDLGNRWVDESGDVTCSVVCWSGDDDTASLLARADDLLDLIDVALVADPRLGTVLAAGHFARVLGRQSLAQTGDANGVKVALTFTVRYSTLLI